MGAYISALILKEVPSFWTAMGVVLVAALIVGTIAGLIANRVRGVYFALVTFGLAQVAARAVYNTRSLGASDGLIGVPIVPIHLGVGTIMSNAPASFFIFTLSLLSFFTWPAPTFSTRPSAEFLWHYVPMSGACHFGLFNSQCAGGGLCISGSHRVALWGALSHAARVRIS
jgi:hypothetical protein